MNIKASFNKASVRRWWLGATVMAALTGLSSCSIMTEDYDNCPWELYVNFKYDYNIDRADMFRDHVGGVTLYVFDDAGKLVERREVTNAGDGGVLKDYNYKMQFTDLPAGKYTLYAMAMQKGYDEAIGTRGAKYRRTEPLPGETADKLLVRLDRADNADADGFHAVENEGMPMDTLWMSLGAVDVTVEAKEKYSPVYATIPLIRDTKRLTLTLRQIDKPTEIGTDDFDIYITDANGLVHHDNTIEDDGKLKYTPYAEWQTEEDINATDKRNVVHAELNFNRLIDHNDADKDARLVVVNKKTGKKVADINLPAFLAQGRDAFSYYNYTPQEYLDRQHAYYLDLFLNGGEWIYMDLKVLSWSVRIQNTDL